MDKFIRVDYHIAILKNFYTNRAIILNIIASKLSATSTVIRHVLRKWLMSDLFFIYRIVWRHYLWELYLNKVLRMHLREAHHEADMLEHSSSDELINRIEEILGHPKYDVNGNPIPDKNGKMVELKNHIPLNNLKAGEWGKVIKINDLDDNFLSYLDKGGIVPNQIIKVKEKISFDKSSEIIFRDKKLDINNAISENIFVEKQ